MRVIPTIAATALISMGAVNLAHAQQLPETMAKPSDPASDLLNGHDARVAEIIKAYCNSLWPLRSRMNAECVIDQKRTSAYFITSGSFNPNSEPDVPANTFRGFTKQCVKRYGTPPIDLSLIKSCVQELSKRWRYKEPLPDPGIVPENENVHR